MFSYLYKNSNKVLLLFIFILLIQAFDQSFGWGLNLIFPKIYFYTFGTIDEGWNSSIWSENGLVENIQILLLLISITILLNLYLKFNIKVKIIKYFIILELIGLFYFFLEEISWGQHLFGFNSFNIFLAEESILFNKQGETNLHNISNLFNEIPRSLVIIWCILPFFFYQITNKQNIIINIIVPSKKLINISLIISLFVFPDLILGKLNLIDHSSLHIIKNGSFAGFDLQTFFVILISSNYFRLSELQELLFAYYFLWHSFYLKKLLVKNFNIK